jgi:hypothetical protein
MAGLRHQGAAVQKMIRQYPDASCTQIASFVGTSRNTVVRWRALLGLPREPHPAKLGWPERATVTKDNSKPLLTADQGALSNEGLQAGSLRLTEPSRASCLTGIVKGVRTAELRHTKGRQPISASRKTQKHQSAVENA